MDPIELVPIVDDAVTASAGTRLGDAYWERLLAATGVGFVAADLALGMLGADLPAVRVTGCDLVGVACNGDDGPHRWAAEALVELARREADDDVVLSIARALMHVRDPIAVPVLVALAAHERSDVRLRAAMALPAAMGDGDYDSGVEALIKLSGDADAETRNWATFGLGRQVAVDGRRVREALWARVDDDDADVREEGICGLVLAAALFAHRLARFGVYELAL